uniref:Uncharacterized protein n=1 Tax=Anguilla anguilla TaxID=7936 RepID=A0A0E9USR9_ANGAN
MTMPLGTQQGLYRNGCVEELNKPVQSTDLNSIDHLGVNWKANREPGQSVPNLTNAFLAE